MDQLKMFGEGGQSKNLPTDVMSYFPGLFDAEESAVLLNTFITQTTWVQRVVKMYDKQVVTPRLTAWYGDIGKSYSYTGSKFSPLPWTKELLMIKGRVEPIAGVNFNSVLLNYYRDNNDSVAWHSDNEEELGLHPVIASVSFGQVRRFDIRHKQDHQQTFSVRLENGSLLVMKGDLQQKWEHRIEKSKVPMKARVNLTFRVIH